MRAIPPNHGSPPSDSRNVANHGSAVGVVHWRDGPWYALRALPFMHAHGPHASGGDGLLPVAARTGPTCGRQWWEGCVVDELFIKVSQVAVSVSVTR